MGYNNQRREIDIEKWKRKEHYEFFSKMREPFHGVCVEVDADKAYQSSKTLQTSLFIVYMYALGKAIHEVENFRYRIEDERVYCYDFVELGSTIGRSDETFGFGLLGYDPNFEIFCNNAKKEIQRVQSIEGLCLESNQTLNNVVYCSTLPWIRFTGLTHARHYDYRDSIPKISFGKCSEINGKRTLPVAIFVDHSLVDGVHVAKLIERLQYHLDNI
ncbi:chloramphenicol acetyltransferase [Prolixibacteraceae bacterium]|nr:chloramphenicol acetyltransferase [Prolixibacteraceae bacterium]